jgi:DNA repair protein RadC
MGEYQPRIKELPLSDQPRERLLVVGPAALSDAELLAILLRVGVPGLNVLHLAQQTLLEYGGWSGLLRVDHGDLCRRHGMGVAKAATVKAALEIGRRLLLAGPDERMHN